MSTLTWPSGEAGAGSARRRCRPGSIVLGRQPWSRTKRAKAAGAVAALLHLGAVGVEDAVVEVRAREARRLHQQHLIAADAEAPVREPRGQSAVMSDLRDAVEHDEVVAEALHLGEVQSCSKPNGA
jgi:hypothetical protein